MNDLPRSSVTSHLPCAVFLHIRALSMVALLVFERCGISGSSTAASPSTTLTAWWLPGTTTMSLAFAAW